MVGYSNPRRHLSTNAARWRGQQYALSSHQVIGILQAINEVNLNSTPCLRLNPHPMEFVKAAEMTEFLEITYKSLEIITLVGGGGYAIFKIGRVAEKVQLTLDHQNAELDVMKQELKTLNELMTNVAIQKQQMATMQEHINRLEGWYDELRRGTGFIQGDRGVNHIYPRDKRD